MSLGYILQQLDALGPLDPRKTLVLDQSFTGSTGLVTLFRSVLQADSLTINVITDLISRTPEQLVLVGTASVLGMTDAGVKFTATDNNGELGVKIEFTVPNGWEFSKTLPELPEGPPLFDIGLVQGNEPHFLDQLSLGASTLVVSNMAYRDETLGLDVVPGLNFSGELFFMGALFGLGYLVEGDAPVRLSGPLSEYRPAADPLQFLGVRLSAPFVTPLTNLGPFSIQKSEIYVKASRRRQDVDRVTSATQLPGIYVLINGEFAGRPLQMIGKYDVEHGASGFFVRGRFTDFAVSGFAGLTQSVGVDGLAETMPENSPAPEGLSITEFGIGVDTIDRSITALLLGVGFQMNWDVIPDVMTLREVTASFFVSNPFDTQRRYIQTTLSGLLAFKKFNLAASATFPTYEFSAGLPAGQTLPLGDVIESFAPGSTDLPDLTITRLLLSAAPKTAQYSVSAAMENLLSIPVGKTSFDLSSFMLNVAYDKAAGGARGTLTARMKMGDARAVISGDLNQAFTFSGSLENFDLKKFWALVTNGESLPQEVPDLIFQTIALSYTPKTGAFSLNGNATVAWDHLTNDGSLSTNVQFTFNHTKAGDKHLVTASLSLQGQGPVNIVDGFSIETFNLLFNYNTTAGWGLAGGIGVGIFDTRLDLQAGYDTTGGVQKFKLRTTATPAKKLVGIENVFSYSFQQFDLLIDRRLVGDKRKTFFDVRLASRLELDKLFAIDGFLSLVNTPEGKQALSFRPNTGTAGFDIKFPTGEGMGVKTDIVEIGFGKESPSASWALSGTVQLGFHDFPAFLGKALPSKVTAKIVAGKNLVRISALNPSDPIGIQFPKANGKDLGKAYVQLTEIGIDIRPQLGLVIEAGLGLPAELNTYLGSQIFRVYTLGNPTTMARTRFTISGTGVAIQFIGSPFAGANAVVINNESWFDVDFGEYGAVRLKMPTFIYDGVSQYFEAGGGVQITRTLALPLAPLRMFLEAVDAKAMADIFPKKIPIDGLVLVDKNNDLKVDEFVNFIKKAGDVPNEVVKTLKQTGKLLNRFPDGFKQYFNLQVPDSLEFKFGFSPTGRIAIGLLAPKKPVRVLFPSVVQSYVPMPGLCGIEVRKFTVGTLMAGSLLYGEVDAIIDQFDLPSLVVSLALPTDPSFPLPTSDQLQRRIILDDVFCIIPISAGLPVPIPLFYDEIGFEYLGVEGIGLQAHIGFPKPNLGAAQATAVFQALKDFTSDSKKLLDPKTPPGGVDLAFTFHDEYFQAPEYVGGKMLGTKGKNIKVGTWKNVASMMNFCKTFSINDCIQSIPIEQRVGSAEYKFAFMSFDADWMLTTPAEFKGGAYQRLKLSQSDVEDFVTVLPSVAMTAGSQVKGNEEGLVAFVRGQADLGFLRLEAALGLAASGSMGFNTGFKFEGAIGKIVFELEGAVMINSPLATGGPTLVTQVAPSATFTPKSAGKALALNGKNAWIEIPASDSLVLPEYTIELWLRSAKDQTGDWLEVFGEDTLQGGNQRNHYLEINAKKAFYHHRFKDAKSGNSGAPNTPDGSVTWGQWQHVVLTNDGTTAKTYIDGKEVASGPVNGSLVLFKEPIFIGKVPGTGTNKFWKGEIAEVRIWKSVRDPDDIEEFMREVLQGDEKDLVSCYQFDADTGNKALDLCGRNHGTINNGQFVDNDLLRFEGLEFDGKSTYIEVPDSESLRIGPYTVEAWVKPFVPEEKLNDILAKRVQVTGRMFGTKVKKVESKPPWAGIFGKVGRNYTMIIHRNGFVHHRFHTTKGTNDGAPNTA
ncbi:MAG TPA: LamG domain-containing protein, partial [Polyangium sp.]|nr:LamG domain-containing protein [Polyangium sp.]